MAGGRQDMIERRFGCNSFFAAAVIVAIAGGCSSESSDARKIEETTRDQCVEHLRNSLLNEERWAKVHAAEFLVSLDYRGGVEEEFQQRLQLFGDEPEYRIGIWRVLAQLNRHDRVAYDKLVGQIKAAFEDESGPDRVHAVETLAKLGVAITVDDSLRESVDTFAKTGPINGRAYAWWVLLNSGDGNAEAHLSDLLSHSDFVARQTAAYALRHQGTIAPETQKALSQALSEEPQDSPALIYLTTAFFRHSSGAQSEQNRIKEQLLGKLTSGKPHEQYEVARLAADVGDEWTAELLSVLQNENADADVRSSVTHSLCRIGRREQSRMPTFDWMVVAFYGFGMLAVGLFYARRTRTVGDYLLGGRNMSPWMVGLSLFATMLSTLSYLAWPGEMIKNGPIILMGYAAYPFVLLVVGWFLIPQIMKLRVTSAYEILELRFGISVRLLGSFLFLSLRFLWMASIIYWTTSIVLIPAAGIDESHTPMIAMVLGLVTVIYTSLGGLRAVVLTDVIQTFVLFAGAIASLVLITSALGGVTNWLPNQWATHWSAPKLWFDFDPNTRATLANAMLGTFSWYVCTAGADQMAIQRYLATKDVKAARRTLAVSLSTDFVVIIFLGLMGLALLAFFSARPDRLADGHTVYANADKLFPRFVVVGLPLGMSGLVIAGLLSAAMSSLSSGVNSSAAVISEDFVRRFAKRQTDDASRIRLVRWTSVCVGMVVVLLSSQIGNVRGNMLEVVYKVGNLFTAPLFYLFFMAIFVGRANAAGTWVGSIAGIVTAVSIAFWKDFFGTQGISFLWIIPSSFFVSVVIGTAGSLLFGPGSPRISIPEQTSA
ncbi:MAG: sodium/solute symporter [Planctomycetales bacterium]|nr:sodium/solute symporter [Planctomycetales bacterium]